MKKPASISVFIILAVATSFAILPGCSWFGEDGTVTFDNLDSAMETLAEQYDDLLETKAYLTMAVTESDDTEEIFDKFTEVDTKTTQILKTIDYLEQENNKMFDETGAGTATETGALFSTAFADQTNQYGVDTGLRQYGVMRSIGNFLTKNQYRDQDEAIRMGIYAGYKEIEKTFPGDAETHIKPMLRQLGVEKIEDIFYTDLDNVKEFYKQTKDLPEGYGANFKSYKDDMYETLREGKAKDMYAYMDNVTAIIDKEVEAGKYEEYVPKPLADFMIRTRGYDEFSGYIEQRRENRLALQNEVVEEPLNMNLADFLKDNPDDYVGDDYFGEGYDKGDDTEVVIAFDEKTGQLIINKIDTNKGNSINLPEGSYAIYATADGNLPVSSGNIAIQQGQTTTLNNATVKRVQINQDFLDFIASLGQTTITLPTKEEITEKQRELKINEQLKAQLEHQLEILKSMEGGSFTTISPEARSRINGQLSEVNKKISNLEEELTGYEALTELTGEPTENTEYPDFLTAIGNWNSNYGDKGTVNVEFPTAGGPVTGHFGGCSSGACWSSTATGQYDGGDGGTVSGSIDGYLEATSYTSAYTISGSFTGAIHLKDGYASGNFSLSLYGGGSSYSDSGSWYASFDNELSE